MSSLSRYCPVYRLTDLASLSIWVASGLVFNSMFYTQLLLTELEAIFCFTKHLLGSLPILLMRTYLLSHKLQALLIQGTR
ncbi:hypothetical protein V8C34DRAFT_289331 [Trichoderma compactum]